MEKQIEDVLEKENNWEKLQDYVEMCSKSKNIRDIVNSEICQGATKHEQRSKMQYIITMTFNTDGIPLYKSSSVSIWPVYLVINELPPVLRFAPKNMILWGVWQGKGKP